VLVPVYNRREVALQEECLAQPFASIEEQHLPNAPVVLPGAIHGRKFERPIIKGSGLMVMSGIGLVAVSSQFIEMSTHRQIN
jgi:hypothetical protein